MELIRGTQTALIELTTNKEEVSRLASALQKEIRDGEVTWELAEADEHIYAIHIIAYGNAKYYPSNSWYDPDDWDIDEGEFLGMADALDVREWFMDAGFDTENINNIEISDIELVDGTIL